jgi:hypothetical protein
MAQKHADPDLDPQHCLRVECVLLITQVEFCYCEQDVTPTNETMTMEVLQLQQPRYRGSLDTEEVARKLRLISQSTMTQQQAAISKLSYSLHYLHSFSRRRRCFLCS